MIRARKGARSWAYTCDTLDRLLSATNAGDATLSNTFTYDAAHNMLSNSQVGPCLGKAGAYPVQGPAAVRPHAATTVTGAGGTYTLAAACPGVGRGRQRQRHSFVAAAIHVLAEGLGRSQRVRSFGGTSQAYTWDAENKLAGVMLGAVQHNYLYAADNARVLHVVPNAAGDRITRFLGPAAEIDETGTWTKHVHADVKRTGNGAAAQASYMHRDHLASVRVITDAAALRQRPCCPRRRNSAQRKTRRGRRTPSAKNSIE
jgi:hypothetical protein